jgi:hypothetical protein
MFLRVEMLDEDEPVTCPRCEAVFQPDEVEILDPEDD